MNWLAAQEALLGALAPGHESRERRMAARVHRGFEFPFRVAEAPALVPADIFALDGAAVLQRLRPLIAPRFLAAARQAVPERFRAAAPRRPRFFATDFARAFHADGTLRHPMPELQSFPGNYFLWKAQLQPTLQDMSAAGFDGGEHGLGFTTEAELDAFLGQVVLGGCDPALAAIIEVEPLQQKTFVDAFLMARTLGVVLVDPRDLRIAADGALEAQRWISASEAGPCHHEGSRRIERAHVRCLPDELDAAGFDAARLARIFRTPEERGRVSFSVHPEDFFLVSKATLCGADLDPPLVAADEDLLQRLASMGLALADGVLKPVDGAGGRGVLGVRERLSLEDVAPRLAARGRPLTHLWQQRYEAHRFSRRHMDAAGDSAGSLQQEIRIMWVLPDGAAEPRMAGSMVRWSEPGELSSAGRARAPGTGTQTPVIVPRGSF